MKLLALFAAWIIIVWFAMPASSHEWYTAQRSPEGKSCCGGNDCAPVAYEGVSCDAAGCDVTVLPGTHPMLNVEDREVCSTNLYGGSNTCYTRRGLGPAPVTFRYDGNPGLSPDGDAHACIVLGDIAARKVRCLFIGGLM